MSPISNGQRTFPRNQELRSSKTAYGREDFLAGQGARSKGIRRQEVWVGLRVSISKKLPGDAATTVWAARNEKVSRGSEINWREVRGF